MQLRLIMKNYFLQFIAGLLSYLVPKQKNLVVFGAGDAKQFQGNPKYLYLYLYNQQATNLSFYWSTKSKAQQKILQGKRLPFINPYSLKGFWFILRAKYLVIEKSSFDVYYTKMILGRFNFIQTWHGTPLKMIGIDASNQNNANLFQDKNKIIYKLLKKFRFFSRQKYRLILAPSEEIAVIFKSAFENNRVQVTGYPRNDVFFNQKLSLKDYRIQFQLNTFNKIILYAPTFRDNNEAQSPFDSDLKAFNKQLREKNYFMLVKKHPWQKNFTIPEGMSHISDVSSQVDDIQELLPYIDILVTDYSSVFYDFMITQKPIVFYPYDYEEYITQCRHLYFNYYNDLPGPFAKNEEELIHLICHNTEWFENENYQKSYEDLIARFNQFQDGFSSQRVLNLMFPDLLGSN